jgi:hypothetical protein
MGIRNRIKKFVTINDILQIIARRRIHMIRKVVSLTLEENTAIGS